jgi:hypothetical protein
MNALIATTNRCAILERAMRSGAARISAGILCLL